MREKLRDVVLHYKPYQKRKDRYDLQLFINGKHVECFGYMDIPEIGSFEATLAHAIGIGYRQAVQDFNLEPPITGPWIDFQGNPISDEEVKKSMAVEVKTSTKVDA